MLYAPYSLLNYKCILIFSLLLSWSCRDDSRVAICCFVLRIFFATFGSAQRLCRTACFVAQTLGFVRSINGNWINGNWKKPPENHGIGISDFLAIEWSKIHVSKTTLFLWNLHFLHSFPHHWIVNLKSSKSNETREEKSNYSFKGLIDPED